MSGTAISKANQWVWLYRAKVSASLCQAIRLDVDGQRQVATGHDVEQTLQRQLTALGHVVGNDQLASHIADIGLGAEAKVE